MFLSRVEVPWDFVRNPYGIHRQLWRMFPGEARETRRNGEELRQGFLFRVEVSRLGHRARVLVQSRRKPNTATNLVLLGTREINPKPQTGQRLAFLLTANPIKTITDTEREQKPGKKSDKCRVPLIREEEQREWLIRKLAGAAEVEVERIQAHLPLYFRKGNRAGKLVTVTYEGILNVTGADTLVALLVNGIGPAKGFGCGLLLVRRV
jgi:CRISPR system Cascade subunit CasE